MVLIADSGSTKTDWLFIDPSEKKTLINTEGINPMVQTVDMIETIINDLPNLNVDKVFFYGASCSSKQRVEKVKQPLQKKFSNCSITVSHDIQGAVYALCGNDDGIACILGTGSNSILQVNRELKQINPALGFILGDEGSGASIGKRLARDFLYQQMPSEIYAIFKNELALSKNEIFDRIYNKENPNRYLASFTRGLSNHIEHPYTKKIVGYTFQKFIKYHIACFSNYQSYRANFVGSIAHHFKSILIEECDRSNIRVGKIIKQPIYDLSDYILNEEDAKNN